METLVRLPESAAPNTISEVLAALRKEHLDPRHESKAWGDWIYLECYNTVISIESNRGLSSSATIEHGEGEDDGDGHEDGSQSGSEKREPDDRLASPTGSVAPQIERNRRCHPRADSQAVLLAAISSRGRST